MSNCNCKVSLIIPTYNSEVTLPNTLNSIREQNLSNVEVVVIDGGSNDGTLKTLASQRDLISVLVSEPDQGIYDAINKGIALASGALIAIIGSDDELFPGALTAIFAAWQSSNAGIVAGRAAMISSDGTATWREDEDYGIGSLLSGIPFCHNAMFVTKETYRQIGKYDLRYRICSDAEWVHRAIRANVSCKQIDVPVVRFALHGVSSSNPEQIMRETYQVICGNFPGLSMDDAEILFRAIRGWSNGDNVKATLNHYSDDPELLIAAAEAFRARSRGLAFITREINGAYNELGILESVVNRFIGLLK